MTYKFVNIYLSNSESEELKLSYEVRPHKLGQLWARSLKEAIPSGLREDNRLYNFHSDSAPVLSSIFNKIDEVIAKLKEIHPDLNLPSFDREDIQGSVNCLHAKFCHSNSCIIDNSNSRLWYDLNIFLHQLEAFENSEAIKGRYELPMAEILITWHDVRKTKIEEEDFAEFDLQKTFGTAYFLYAEVGRHIFEIYMAKDKDVPRSQIKPARFFSADTSLWFGPDLGHWAKNHLLKHMQTWYGKYFDLEKELGISFGDPKLSIGHVPVGRLVNSLYSDSEKKNLISNIARFNTVARVEVF